MGKYLTFWLGMFLLLAITCYGETAGAMTAFARKYNMKCADCHRQRIPELNDFGVTFYKNGFVLPGNESAGKQAGVGTGVTVTPASGKEGTKASDGAEKKASTKEGATVTSGSADDTEEEDAEEEPPKEPPPTVVYRLPSKDGSVYFTDNPVRKEALDADKRERVRKSLPRRLKVVRVVKRLHAKPVAEQKAPMQPHRIASRPERFCCYEECMEHYLVDASQPESAQEMMDVVMAAERKCAAFPAGKR